MKLPFVKTNANTRRPRRNPGFWSTLMGARRGDTMLPANVTGEDDWDVEVPHIRMSRAFIIMLVLHIVAIGGLVAFNIWGKDEARPAEGGDIAANNEPGDTAAALPVEDELRTHVFQVGDTLPLIAARYSVNVSDLEAINSGLMPPAAGVKLFIPRTPRHIGPADVAPTGTDPLEPAMLANEPKSNSPAPETAPNPSLDEIPLDLQAASEPVVATTAPAEPKVAPALESETNPTPAPAPATAVKQTKDRDIVDVTPPPATPVKPRPAPAKATPEKAAGQRTHVVSKGDTVFNVARRYGCSPAEIMKLNGIKSNSVIGIGQILKVPVKR